MTAHDSSLNRDVKPADPAVIRRGLPSLRLWALRLLAVAACGAVFLSYLRPELAVDWGNRLMACF